MFASKICVDFYFLNTYNHRISKQKHKKITFLLLDISYVKEGKEGFLRENTKQLKNCIFLFVFFPVNRIMSDIFP